MCEKMVSYKVDNLSELGDITLSELDDAVKRHNVIIVRSIIGTLFIFKASIFGKGFTWAKMILNPIHAEESKEFSEKVVSDIRSFTGRGFYTMVFITILLTVTSVEGTVKVTML